LMVTTPPCTVEGVVVPVIESIFDSNDCTLAVVRGVEVAAGRHRIEMHYSPWSVKLGAAGLGLSLLGLLALAYSEPKARSATVPRA